MLSKFRLFTFVRRNVYFANRTEFHDRKTKINGLVLKQAPEIRILNNSEKSYAAKRIVSFLSRGTERMHEGLSAFNNIFEFDCMLFNQNCKMIVTSVYGHSSNYSTQKSYKNFNQSGSSSSVLQQSKSDLQSIKKTLEREIKTCSNVIVWTDCDSKGDRIGFQIIEIFRIIKPKPNVQVYRAKPSKLSFDSFEKAVRVLTPLDERLNINEVNVKQELDLKKGASFARLQTKKIQMTFPAALGQNLINCQYPARKSFSQARNNFSTQRADSNSNVSYNNDNSNAVDSEEIYPRPKCYCGNPALLLTVKKSGPNVGRKFYKCSHNDCQFFLWVDDINGNKIQQCFCGFPCVRRTVIKEGPNKGKAFYGCSKPFSDPSKCKFFQWVDKENENDTSNEIPVSQSSNKVNAVPKSDQTVKAPPKPKKSTGTATKKQKCGLCGEDGHTSLTCPNK